MFCLVEAARDADRSRVGDHAIHWRRVTRAGVAGRGRRLAGCLCSFLGFHVGSLLARSVLSSKISEPGHEEEEVIHAPVHSVEATDGGSWRTLSPSVV